ncbi:MAG: hypothetical protein U0230_07650 [Polyangiales bacterium]
MATSPRIRSALVAVLAVALFFACASWLRVRATRQYFATRRYEDVYYVPPPVWLSAMSLGHREALADVLWMKALIYFGDEYIEHGSLEHVFDYGEAILTLDPDFLRAYRWVGMAGMYRPTGVGPDEVRRSIEYLKRGFARFPESGELAWELGAAYTYELAPLLTDAAERNAARAEGARYLELAARRGAGPPWLALSNASTLLRLGQRQRAADHLREMYLLVRDEATRAEIAQRIAALESETAREALVQTLRNQEAERRANYSYLPASFYELVGPRIVDPPPLTATP